MAALDAKSVDRFSLLLFSVFHATMVVAGSKHLRLSHFLCVQIWGSIAEFFFSLSSGRQGFSAGLGFLCRQARLILQVSKWNGFLFHFGG
jgi:hypothetical protein